jgi:hypothetical protein
MPFKYRQHSSTQPVHMFNFVQFLSCWAGRLASSASWCYVQGVQSIIERDVFLVAFFFPVEDWLLFSPLLTAPTTHWRSSISDTIASTWSMICRRGRCEQPFFGVRCDVWMPNAGILVLGTSRSPSGSSTRGGRGRVACWCGHCWFCWKIVIVAIILVVLGCVRCGNYVL